MKPIVAVEGQAPSSVYGLESPALPPRHEKEGVAWQVAGNRAVRKKYTIVRNKVFARREKR
jgi:hypothetical protein